MTETPAAGTRFTASTPGPATPGTRTSSTGLDDLVRTVTAPLAGVASLVPAGPVPVALGAGALAVAGIIEWPLAAAIGLGYLALRRWR